jgi:hypothetical protein
MIVGLVIVMVLIAGVVGFSFYVSVQMERRNLTQGPALVQHPVVDPEPAPHRFAVACPPDCSVWLTSARLVGGNVGGTGSRENQLGERWRSRALSACHREETVLPGASDASGGADEIHTRAREAAGQFVSRPRSHREPVPPLFGLRSTSDVKLIDQQEPVTPSGRGREGDRQP